MESLARGRALAREKIVRLAPYAKAVARRIAGNPVLGIIATDDDLGRKFVRIKEEALADVCVDIRASWLHASAETSDALDVIARLNGAPDIDGVFLQFPLPRHVDAATVSNAVAEAKDVDGSASSRRFHPAAALSAYDLLVDQLQSLGGRKIVIAGEEDTFTRALCALLDRHHASVRMLATGENDTPAIRDIDALVVTDVVPMNEVLNELTNLPVLLDTAYYLPPRASDFIPEELRSRIGIHLTQYGNVGPLTVAHLAAATITAAER